jgi:hypothetical protein
MNKQQWILLSATVALIAGAGGILQHLHSHQNLGRPGVTTSPIPGSIRLRVDLPEKVLDYRSKWFDVDELTLNVLPADTSFGHRRYVAPDDRTWHDLSVVLMGADRTSLHKPQFCLEGMGFHIEEGGTLETTVHIERPTPYELPVVRLLASGKFNLDGQTRTIHGVYVYWFVADDALSASVSGMGRMWSLASHFMRTGVLQRWAYVSCFSICGAGQDEATFERMKKFIAEAVPEFQIRNQPSNGAVVSK